MAGIWTKERRKKHSLRIRQLVKEGLYKRAMMRPEVVEANRQRAIERQKDPKFKRRHKLACQKWARENIDKIREGAANRDNTNQIAAAKDPVRRKKVSAGQTANWANNDERRSIMSEFKTSWWENLNEDDKNSMIKKIMSSNGSKPNRSERRLEKVFEYLQLGYRFVGDGKLVIAGRCPDFVNKSRKEIIEFNGTYWHTDRVKDKERLKAFVKEGYRCLAIYAGGVDKKNIRQIVDVVKSFRDGKSRYSPICMATCS